MSRTPEQRTKWLLAVLEKIAKGHPDERQVRFTQHPLEPCGSLEEARQLACQTLVADQEAVEKYHELWQSEQNLKLVKEREERERYWHWFRTRRVVLCTVMRVGAAVIAAPAMIVFLWSWGMLLKDMAVAFWKGQPPLAVASDGVVTGMVYVIVLLMASRLWQHADVYHDWWMARRRKEKSECSSYEE